MLSFVFIISEREGALISEREGALLQNYTGAIEVANTHTISLEI